MAHGCAPQSPLFYVSLISLCSSLGGTPMIAFSAHPDNPGYPPCLMILNLTPFTKTLFPCKRTFTGSRGQDPALRGATIQQTTRLNSSEIPTLLLFTVAFSMKDRTTQLCSRTVLYSRSALSRQPFCSVQQSSLSHMGLLNTCKVIREGLNG